MTDGVAPTQRKDNARTPDSGVLVMAIGLAVMAAVVLWMVFTAPKVATYARIGPQAVPAIVGWCLAALSVATFVEAFRVGKVQREPIHWGPMLWIVGGLAAQLFTLKMAGFSIATGLLFAATAKAFGRGPIWLTAPFGFVLSFVIYAVFAKGLKLSLPAGPVERFIFQLLG